jgi:hypothetical protein
MRKPYTLVPGSSNLPPPKVQADIRLALGINDAEGFLPEEQIQPGARASFISGVPDPAAATTYARPVFFFQGPSVYFLAPGQPESASVPLTPPPVPEGEEFSVTVVEERREFDPSSATIGQALHVLATLIDTLKQKGIV